MQEHTRFVNAVRYAPDGSIFVSGGADGRVRNIVVFANNQYLSLKLLTIWVMNGYVVQAIVFNGENGEKVGEFGSPAHKGGIYAVSYN